jgi:AcrR family transcriptional regulator
MPRPLLSQVEVDAFREDLVGAALQRFAAHGYAGVTLRGLAADLGCSPMTPYRYFRDKDEIFSAVRAAAFARFADALERADRGAGPVERLRALGRAYVRFALGEPDAYRVMFELGQPDAGGYPELLTQGQRAWESLRNVIGDAVTAGKLAGDPRLLAHICWAGLHGAVSLQLAGKLGLGCALEDLVEPIMDTLVRGAGCPSRGSQIDRPRQRQKRRTAHATR